jgi:hypothetical protein
MPCFTLKQGLLTTLSMLSGLVLSSTGVKPLLFSKGEKFAFQANEA